MVSFQPHDTLSPERLSGIFRTVAPWTLAGLWRINLSECSRSVSRCGGKVSVCSIGHEGCHVETWEFAPDSLEQDGWQMVEFKLLYQGKLPAATASDTRSKDKHLIRKQFHNQLKYLWQVQEPFAGWTRRVVPAMSTGIGRELPLLEHMANNYARCGYRFLPVVTESHSLSCELDILFLRRDPPGKLISAGGDIDNRIKVLFDALRMPVHCAELGSYPVGEGEDPFYVLLEDDSLITKVSVSTDRLLLPKGDGEHMNDVMLVVGVRVKVVAVSRALSNLQFL